MNCKKCGTMIEDGANFCTNCGSHIEVKEITSQTPGNNYSQTFNKPNANYNQNNYNYQNGLSGSKIEFLENYYKKEKNFLTIVIISAICFLICLILCLIGIDSNILYLSLFVLSLVTLYTFLYFLRFIVGKKNYKRFLQYGNNYMLYDIDEKMRENPKSPFVFGKSAFVINTNPIFIISYSQVAWAYSSKHSINYSHIYDSANFVTKDGIAVELPGMNVEVLTSIVQKYILPNSPNVILGFGKEQTKKYKQMYPKIKKYNIRKFGYL